jgi:hypothetical protein
VSPRARAAFLQRSVLLGFLALAAPDAEIPAADAAGGAASVPTVGVNLLDNGDFSTAASAQAVAGPRGWDIPDGKGVRWCDCPGGGKGIRMDTSLSEQAMVAQWHAVGNTTWDIPHPGTNAVAETYGLSFYSQPLVITPGASYRVTYEFQGPAGGVKLWVRGYGEHNGEQQRLWEAVINGQGGGEGWHPVTFDVHPTLHRPGVREIKIMLYAYYPAGVYWFRHISMLRLADPASAAGMPASAPAVAPAPAAVAGASAAGTPSHAP